MLAKKWQLKENMIFRKGEISNLQSERKSTEKEHNSLSSTGEVHVFSVTVFWCFPSFALLAPKLFAV